VAPEARGVAPRWSVVAMWPRACLCILAIHASNADRRYK
jgi:hypothetical protein